MKKKVKFVAVQLIIVLGLLLALEVSVRTFAPQIKVTGTDAELFEDHVEVPHRRLSPGTVGESHGEAISVDSLGFLEYSPKRSPAKQNVLLLGDSVTMGIGVEPDSTFGGRLAQTVNVYNPSVIGYNSQDYLGIVKVLAQNQSPYYESTSFDHALIFWCLNDVYSSTGVQGSPGDRSPSFLRGVLDVLRQNSRTYHWLKAVVTDRPKRYYEFDARLYASHNVETLLAIDALNDAIEILDQAGIQTTLVLLPYEYQLRTADNKPQQFLVAHISDTSEVVKVVDLYDPFALQDSITDLFLYGDGIHLSNRGHRLVADVLIDALAQDGATN